MPSTPYTAVARYSYTPEAANAGDDLAFGIGQLITVTEEVDSDWLFGSYKDAKSGEIVSGYFPRTFVEAVQEAKKETKKVSDEQAKDVPIEEAKEVTKGAATPVAAAPAEKAQPEVPSLPQPVDTDPAAPVPQAASPTSPTSPSAIRNRINTFNVESAAPLPGRVPEQSFVKRQFTAANEHSSYIPPPIVPQPLWPKKEEHQQQQQQPDVVTREVISESTHQEEESGPKITLKERLRLLEERQKEEQQALEAAMKRREEKKKKRHSLGTNVTGESLRSSKTGESLRSSKTGESEFSEAREERIDEHEEGKIPGEAIQEENVKEEVGVTDLKNDDIEEEEEGDDEEEGEEDEDEDEDEGEDEEELRRRRLRERMAKLSGGMGMLGMMGFPGTAPTGSSPEHKRKPSKSKKKTVEEQQASELPVAVPVMPFANPALVAAMRQKEGEVSDEDESPEEGEYHEAQETRVVAEEPESESEEEEPQIAEKSELAPPIVTAAHPIETAPPPPPPPSHVPTFPVEQSDSDSDSDSEAEVVNVIPNEDQPPEPVLETPTTSAPPPVPGARPVAPPVPSARSLKAPPPPPPAAVPESRPAPPIPTGVTAVPAVPRTADVPEVPSNRSPPSLPQTRSPPPIPITSPVYQEPHSEPPHIPSAQTMPRTAPPPTQTAPLPPIATSSSPEVPPVSVAPPSSSPVFPLRSVDARPSVDYTNNASMNDALRSSGDAWWIGAKLPPQLSDSDLHYETEVHEIKKRYGRTIKYVDYYIVNPDLSSKLWELSYESGKPDELLTCTEFSFNRPKPDTKYLVEASQHLGLAAYRAAASSLNGSFDTSTGLVDRVFSQLPASVLPPIAGKTFGAVIYKNNNNIEIRKIEEIRAGDVLVVVKGHFEGKSSHLIKTKKVHDLGFSGKPYVAFVTSYEEQKSKIKVVEQDNGIAKVASYKLGDFKSGKIRVFRIVERKYIGW
ncbi:DEKNAAC105294 [Brettanomyces naardenensis]|uniref:DEKNAAC105294 n=1 Tax=Brettanomyces naardenensis TaxID=13370 RepID=A0A448YSY3_BRENA|nr:DEKNAAC105294 [Brettanomyces naardenensis]